MAISVKKYVVSLIFILLIIFFFVLLCCLNQNIMTTQEKISFLNQVISLLPECIGHDVRRFIACQFALESDFGSSAFALCNNNFCGMKVPALRITLALNNEAKNEFAWFSGITSCVHDYLLWLQSNKFSRTELNNLDTFRSHLGFSDYCPESDYLDKINTIYSQYYG